MINIIKNELDFDDELKKKLTICVNTLDELKNLFS